MTTCNHSDLEVLVIGIKEKLERNKNWKEGRKAPWNVDNTIVNIEDSKESATN